MWLWLVSCDVVWLWLVSCDVVWLWLSAVTWCDSGWSAVTWCDSAGQLWRGVTLAGQLWRGVNSDQLWLVWLWLVSSLWEWVDSLLSTCCLAWLTKINCSLALLTNINFGLARNNGCNLPGLLTSSCGLGLWLTTINCGLGLTSRRSTVTWLDSRRSTVDLALTHDDQLWPLLYSLLSTFYLSWLTGLQQLHEGVLLWLPFCERALLSPPFCERVLARLRSHNWVQCRVPPQHPQWMLNQQSIKQSIKSLRDERGPSKVNRDLSGWLMPSQKKIYEHTVWQIRVISNIQILLNIVLERTCAVWGLITVLQYPYLAIVHLKSRWILVWPSVLLRGERDVRHADPYARLYFETWSKHRQGRTVANRYNTDKAESNPRASVGRRSANNIQ